MKVLRLWNSLYPLFLFYVVEDNLIFRFVDLLFKIVVCSCLAVSYRRLSLLQQTCLWSILMEMSLFGVRQRPN